MMWPEESKNQYLEECSRILVSRYGLPTHGNKKNPLDELIYILLSSQTDADKYQHAYRKLKRQFPSWKQVRIGNQKQIEEIIHPAGLSRLKAKYIVEIMLKIDRDFGSRSLASLKHMSDSAAEKYLLSLLGVGTKSARCVLMYSLQRDVFPVDTHSFRVLRRLGVHNLPLPVRRWHNRIQEDYGYPKRQTARPTTERLLKAFGSIYLSVVQLPNQAIRHVTPLSALQKRILVLLGIEPAIYEGLMPFLDTG